MDLTYIRLASHLGALLLVCLSAVAESSREEAQPEKPNERQVLPGEVVTTPEGQKLRVWTTKGPVPVSQAPEPFEKKDRREIETEVILDGRRPGRSSR